jgi:hypothetical protein
VWSCVVLVGPPASEHDAGLGQRREQRLVQQLIPQPAIEALDEGILHRFARRDVVPCDVALIGPCQDSVAGEFAAVVADNHLRLAALDHQPVQKFVSSNVLRFLLDTSAGIPPVKMQSCVLHDDDCESESRRPLSPSDRLSHQPIQAALLRSLRRCRFGDAAFLENSAFDPL